MTKDEITERLKPVDDAEIAHRKRMLDQLAEAEKEHLRQLRVMDRRWAVMVGVYCVIVLALLGYMALRITGMAP